MEAKLIVDHFGHIHFISDEIPQHDDMVYNSDNDEVGRLQFENPDFYCIYNEGKEEIKRKEIVNSTSLKKIVLPTKEQEEQRYYFKKFAFLTFTAGFNFGSNEGPFPVVGVHDAFCRFMQSKSPSGDSVSYDPSNSINKIFKP